MIADVIARGHILLADWLFLIAVILAVAAAVAAVRPDTARWTPVGGWTAVGCVALAWMLL